MRSLLILLLTLPFIAHSIPEENFETTWKNEVLPFYENLNHGYFKNSQSLRLHFARYIKAENKRTLVILPGQSEPAIKYAELAYDFRNSNVDIYILDHQGQGESERLLNDSQKGHVENFQHYVDDLKMFMEEVVVPNAIGPLYLVAHSMGGAIATLYMDQNPGIIEKATLVAPMFEINTSPYPANVAYLYAKFLNAVRKGEDYAPGRGPYDFNSRFETNLLTQSKVRFEAGRYLFQKWPNLLIGGPTVRWVYTSLKSTRATRSMSVSTPVLLLQAGKDKIVRPRRQNSFCRRNECKKVYFPNAKHEILMEKDDVRNESIQLIRSFFTL